MEFHRQTERNRINERIRQIRKTLENNQETITKYKRQDLNESFFRTQLDRLLDSTNILNGELDRLNARLSMVNTGELDTELSNTASELQASIQQKQQATLKKKKDQVNMLKQQSDTFFGHNTEKRSENISPKELERGLNYYNKVCDSVPEYMLKNLKNMPSNKGYCFRGVWLFGELPMDTSGVTTIFEKSRNDLLIIHEFDKYEYSLYHKVGQDKKVLVSREQRVNKCK